MTIHARALQRVQDAEQTLAGIDGAGSGGEAIRRIRSALFDIRTAENRLYGDTLRHVRSTARPREPEFKEWWKANYPDPPTDELMLWVKEIRDGGAHEGDDPFEALLWTHSFSSADVDDRFQPPGDDVLISQLPEGSFWITGFQTPQERRYPLVLKEGHGAAATWFVTTRDAPRTHLGQPIPDDAPTAYLLKLATEYRRAQINATIAAWQDPDIS
ncbi:hypothetical protein [Rathayibacter sp. SD072]|uniref:hypothetical protein n=1 Tax=Rathayibacter sp. SD072 TaxID=2781731 RepID=UPI001A965588|nr:hypothetical protein [Rathayibacter sp. SD072]MBO0985815.1 hypothetical protein [Rathayibacter sp. SD072]